MHKSNVLQFRASTWVNQAQADHQAERCPEGMIDSRKMREGGGFVDLDTLQQLEQYRHEIYHKAVELARATSLPITVMLDIIKSVETRIENELRMQP